MKINGNIKLVLLLGILIRLILIPHTVHPAVFEKSKILDYLFILGSPSFILGDTSVGISYYYTYAPVYILNNFISGAFNFNYDFVFVSILKIPPLAGDLIIFYALFEIVRLKVNRELAFVTASAYFLNPYVIWLSSAVGHAENLTAGFLLLSILYLIKYSYTKSGIFFGIAVLFRFFPVLLLPAFVFYIFSQKENRGLTKFLLGFIATSLFLALPYFLVIFKLYLESPSSLIQFISNMFGSSGSAAAVAHPKFEQFPYNFTGFLASIGLYTKMQFLLGAASFLITFLAIQTIIILYLKKNKLSYYHLLHFPVILFALFLVQIPLQQHHYLQWAFPFFLLSSYAFKTAPRYFPDVIWVSNLIIDPILSQSYKYYLGTTFPDPFKDKTAYFLNILLQQSLSVLIGLVLVTYLICSIITIVRKENSLKLAKSTNVREHEFTFFLNIVLASYGIVEIFKIAYNIYIINIVSLLLGIFLLMAIIKVINKYNLRETSKEIRDDFKYYLYTYVALLFFFAILTIPTDLIASLFFIIQIGIFILADRYACGLPLSTKTISYIFTLIVATLIILENKSYALLISYFFVVAATILLFIKSDFSLTPDRELNFIESILNRTKNKIALIIALFLVIQFILFVPVIAGNVQNSRSYWCCVNYELEGRETYREIGQDVFYRVWDFTPFWITPFLDEDMKKISRTYVMFRGKFQFDEFENSGSTSNNNPAVVEIRLNDKLIYDSIALSPSDSKITIPIDDLKPENKLEVVSSKGWEGNSPVIFVGFDSRKALLSQFWRQIPFSTYIFGSIFIISLILVIRGAREFMKILES